jgi:hypothetical protein
MKNNPINILKKTNGKFTSVTYTNKLGITKSYTIRTGVRKYVTGYGIKKNNIDSITVFCVDINKLGYKTFKLNGIKKIRCGKLKFKK